ncbi:MAG: bacteriohemerythrin [Rhodospirillales bacterium]|nr:bacteriohemerythrin [Rhodospirillales bacterium]
MTHIDWSQRYKLGIPAIDADHGTLVSMLNRFLNASLEGASDSELAAYLHTLVEEVRAHFQREEAMLDRVNYPELPAHKVEHDRLLVQVQHYEQACQAGEVPRALSLETADYLRHWLLDHIILADMPYRPHVMRLT